MEESSREKTEWKYVLNYILPVATSGEGRESQWPFLSIKTCI
jgi:hypothetical protein